MTARFDVGAVRAALADPIAVARRLGLDKGARRQPHGLLVACPAHGDRTPSMSMTVGGDGTLRIKCFSCGLGGDVLHLVAAVERLAPSRDFSRVLERAAAIAGVLPEERADRRASPPKPRPDRVVDLAARIDAGAWEWRRTGKVPADPMLERASARDLAAALDLLSLADERERQREAKRQAHNARVFPLLADAWPIVDGRRQPDGWHRWRAVA